MMLDPTLVMCRIALLSFCGLLLGCPELRGSRPTKATPSRRPSTTSPGKVEQVRSPITGIEREVVRVPGPQLATSRTPQRLASMEIVERGKAALSRRELDKALQAFQEAVTVDGTNGIAYYYLAKTRYEWKQYDEAVGVLDRAESLLADAPEWLENVAELRRLIQAAGR